MWYPFDKGRTVGTIGFEMGIIVMDEEHGAGLRVTLERDGGVAPWSITCGIYGSFAHTAFATSEEEGRNKYSEMRSALVAITEEASADSRYEMMTHFADVY
jgi:hypothetical protein